MNKFFKKVLGILAFLLVTLSTLINLKGGWAFFYVYLPFACFFSFKYSSRKNRFMLSIDYSIKNKLYSIIATVVIGILSIRPLICEKKIQESAFIFSIIGCVIALFGLSFGFLLYFRKNITHEPLLILDHSDLKVQNVLTGKYKSIAYNMIYKIDLEKVFMSTHLYIYYGNNGNKKLIIKEKDICFSNKELRDILQSKVNPIL